MHFGGPGGKAGEDGRELSGLICGSRVEKRIRTGENCFCIALAEMDRDKRIYKCL